MSGAQLKKVLVANRGEIALRVIRGCREQGIATVAVFSEADRDSLHVRAAHEAYEIGPPAPRESYLVAERILEVARASGADAVHPGYGFLSENAGFARAVEEAGLVWIGPPASAIEEMGDKIAARQRMERAGVPVVPGLSENADDLSKLEKFADQAGYPVLIKASGGGGGKGIRVVREASELASSIERARSEAASGFGNDAVYLEKYLEKARHIEVQVLADRHGHVVHLGERECSMQRRHQKLVEECPSPVVDSEQRARMGEAAVRAAEAVGYVNAGTVEFLGLDTGEFYFLEMNTRLQVEHPVTEMVTGIDLVQQQLSVAAGNPLTFTQDDVDWRGHSIEVRICAEEPERGFLPSTGTVRALEPPGGNSVRFDSALFDGLEIGVHYDPMLAKLIVHAGDRTTAIARLLRALEELKVSGVATNSAFLSRLVDCEGFRTGEFHTQYVEQRLDELLALGDEDNAQTAAVLAAVIHADLMRRRAGEAQAAAPRGVSGSGWSRAGRRAALEQWKGSEA